MAGIVQQLAIHSVGGVVTSAQPLMIIVPDSPTGTAEVSIANQDIGDAATNGVGWAGSLATGEIVTASNDLLCRCAA